MGQLNNYTYTFTPGTKAESDQVNQNFKDIKNAHNATDTAAFYKDGTKAMTGDADMGSNKVTTMADGTAATDAVNKGQLDGVDVLSAKGDLLTFSTVNARKAIGSNDQLLVPDSSKADGSKWTDPGNLSKYFSVQNIKNLIFQNDADADHDINFYRPDTNYPAQFIVRNASYDTRLISYSGEITKRTDATWAAGDDAGGRDSNDTLTADTIYYMLPLVKSSDNTVDVGYTTDPTGVSLLSNAAVTAAGFDEIGVSKDGIGTILTDGSLNILPGKATEESGGGLDFSFDSNQPDLSTSVGTSRTPLVLSVPANSIAKISLNAFISVAGGNRIDVYEKALTNNFWSCQANNGFFSSNRGNIKVDANSQIDYEASFDGAGSLAVDTLGYKIKR